MDLPLQVNILNFFYKKRIHGQCLGYLLILWIRAIMELSVEFAAIQIHQELPHFPLYRIKDLKTCIPVYRAQFNII
jgi:hypothetical protein